MRTLSAGLLMLLCAAASQAQPSLPTAPSPAYPRMSFSTSPPRRLPAQGFPQAAPLTPQTGFPNTTPAAPPASGVPEKLIAFDPSLAQVNWVQGRWVLIAGSVTIKDFGQEQYDARDALRIIQRLRLTARGTVGQPVPIMEYWLSDGQAPQAFGNTLPTYSINLASLRAEQVKEFWVVRDDRQIWFNFGRGRHDAEQAVAIMKKYGFGRIGYLGQPRPAMIYFLASPESPVHQASYPTPQMLPAMAAGQNWGARFLPPGYKMPAEADMNAQEPQAEPVSPTANDAADANGAAGANGIIPVNGPVPPTRNAAPEPAPGEIVQARFLAQGMRQLASPSLSMSGQLRFQTQDVRVRLEGSSWQLVHEEYVLADFGQDVLAAHQALDMLRYYGCNELHLIGHPQPVFSYYLVNGRAPQGLRHGMRGQEFQPQRTKLKQIGQLWYICAGEQPLIAAGSQKADAEALLQAIHRHHFDYFVQLGSEPGRTMPFLLRRY